MTDANKMTKFTRASCAKLQEEVEAALTAVCDEFNIVLAPSRATYLDNEIRLRLTFNTVDESGAVHSAKADAWTRACDVFGFEQEHLGMVFTHRSRKFRITGLNMRARKYPICADGLDDERSYKFPVSAVKKALGLEVSKWD